MAYNKSLLLLLCLFLSCKTSQNNTSKNTALITIDQDVVPTEEFLYVYNKNSFNNDSLFNREEVKDYLDLYINFKLKVKEAEEQGIHNTDAFKEELEGYRKQLAKPYLTENEVTEDLVEEAYERLKTEINAAHILFNLSSNATPEDTLSTYNKALKIRERAIKGENFDTLAKQYSDDPSAATNGGDLGYFTALQMVYPFEDAAYKTPEGQISLPVRTRFGYHLIYVKDKRPSQGQVKVSHIMVRATQGISPEDSLAARKQIFEIYKQLKEGADWFEMASHYSDDISSKSSGGALPWFGTGNMIPEFEKAAFALKQPGDISPPIKTAYGWHIIKLDEKKGLEPFEELRPNLAMKVSKDSRAELNKVALIKRLKKENDFQTYEEVFEKAVADIDSSLVLGKWSYTAESQLLGEHIFTIQDKAYTVKDFYDYITEKQRQQQNMTAAQYMQVLYEQFAEDQLMAYEEAHLADKYEDYRMLLKEYRDGILLFELMDKKVWSKAVEDTAGLRNFYEQNKDNYQWKERAEGTIYTTTSPAILDSVKVLAQQPYYPIGNTYMLQQPLKASALSPEVTATLDNLAKLLLDDYMLKAIVAINDGSLKDEIIAYLKKKDIAGDRLVLEDKDSNNGAASISIVTTSKKWLEKKYNEKNALVLQVTTGKYEPSDLPILSQVEWSPGEYTINEDGKSYYIVIDKILPASQKKLEEIKGQVISDYQNFLEKEWVSALRSKHTVHINEEALKYVFEELESK